MVAQVVRILRVSKPMRHRYRHGHLIIPFGRCSTELDSLSGLGWSVWHAIAGFRAGVSAEVSKLRILWHWTEGTYKDLFCRFCMGLSHVFSFSPIKSSGSFSFSNKTARCGTLGDYPGSAGKELQDKGVNRCIALKRPGLSLSLSTWGVWQGGKTWEFNGAMSHL